MKLLVQVDMCMMTEFVILAATATATLGEDCSSLIRECTIPFMPHLDSLKTLHYVQQYDDICSSVNFYFTLNFYTLPIFSGRRRLILVKTSGSYMD